MGKPQLTADKKRSYIMSRIKSKNTSIELSLRKALWHSNIYFRKHYSMLPGTPDIVITKYHIAIFCDGDFWHGKDWINKKIKIKNNSEYWIDKIERNINRDIRTDQALYSLGWTVVRFWGSDICKDLSGCVDYIKDVIFQIKLDEYNDRYEFVD
jgi:DNA mismatch endonuclease (patch repair protein)